jgi:hypothetical protein
MFDRRTARVATALVVWLGPLLAEGRAANEDSLRELIQAHPECRQFNDGCSICKVENGAAVCSAPGIACIRTAWTCVDGATATGIGNSARQLAKAASVNSAGAAARRATRLP